MDLILGMDLDLQNNHAFALRLQQGCSRESLPPLSTQSHFKQDLHPLWDFAAFSWDGEDRSVPVLTFFVDHRHFDPHCEQGRDVHLFEDYPNWEYQFEELGGTNL